MSRNEPITRTRFSPEEDRQMLGMSAAGKSGRQIAEALGRQVSGINERLRKLRGHPKRQRQAPVNRKRGLSEADLVAGEAKCLGGCGQMFHSPDRKRVRICPSCKRGARCSGLPEAFALALF